MTLVQFKNQITKQELSSLPFIKEVHFKNNQWQLISDSDIREQIFKAAIQNNWILLEMYADTYSVEDVFQKLTK